MRYFLEIAYKGTNYVGWQVQPNGVSVQQKIDEALSTVLRDNIHCIGCGRTDAGVHAAQFFLHFDTAKEFPENFLHRLNSLLPGDIAVKRTIHVSEKSHARFDATLRAYTYYVSDVKDPFRKEFCFYKPFYSLDFNVMQKSCKVLTRYNDFPSFCKSKAGSKTTIVSISEAKWVQSRDSTWEFHISADRFLRGMVRLIVGAMFRIGEGRMTLEEFEEGIQNKKRFGQALSAPAHGLFLTEVRYPYL
jgi:tRNA pseudouridine38-40 synthase